MHSFRTLRRSRLRKVPEACEPQGMYSTAPAHLWCSTGISRRISPAHTLYCSLTTVSIDGSPEPIELLRPEAAGGFLPDARSGRGCSRAPAGRLSREGTAGGLWPDAQCGRDGTGRLLPGLRRYCCLDLFQHIRHRFASLNKPIKHAVNATQSGRWQCGWCEGCGL